MIIIDFLTNHPYTINSLASIWRDVLGKIWMPDKPIELVQATLKTHLNDQELPITFIALVGDKPIGMCSLRENDGIRPDTTPWLGSLVVDPSYQNRGVGKMLIDTVKETAVRFGFEKLYLFAFDATIPDYYTRLGWEKIGMDEYNLHPVTVMEIEL